MSGSGSASSSGAIACRGVLLAADVAPDDPADLAQVQLLGEGRRRRHGVEGEEAVQLARRRREELAVGREHLGARLDRPEGRAADDGADLVQPEQERGDDAEVAAAAADRPEEVGVLVGARADALAAGEHHLGLEQVVDRQAALARQVADAAAEREAADAGGRDDPARGRQAVLVGGGVDLAPGAAAADPDRARLGSTSICFSGERSMTTPSSQVPSPAPLWPPPRTASSRSWSRGEANRRRDVVGVRAARDQRRPLVDHRVVDACAPRRSRRRRGRSAVPGTRRAPSVRRLRLSWSVMRSSLVVVIEHRDER